MSFLKDLGKGTALFLLIGAAIIAAGCATTGAPEGDEEAPAGEDTFAPLDPATEAAVSLGGRVSVGEVVAETPSEWIARRLHDVRPFVKAESLSSNGRATGYLINVDSGGAILPETALRFILSEVAFLDNVPPGEYLQPLPDGSHYAGVDTNPGRAIRTRFYDRERGFHALVVVGPANQIATPEIDAQLRSLRPAQEEERSYRLRYDGLSVVEVGAEPWLWMEDYGEGVALVAEGDEEETFALLSPGSTLSLGTAAAGAEQSTELWVGSRRVIARGGPSADEAATELYGFAIDGEPYQLLLGRPRNPGETALIDEPEVRKMLLTQILIGGME